MIAGLSGAPPCLPCAGGDASLTTRKTRRYTGALSFRNELEGENSEGDSVMRKLLSFPGTVALVAALAAAQAACSQVGVLKARMALRDAVKYYQRQDYKQAAEK